MTHQEIDWHATILRAKTAAVVAELEAMRSANFERTCNGHAQAYDEVAFFAVEAVLNEEIRKFTAMVNSVTAEPK